MAPRKKATKNQPQLATPANEQTPTRPTDPPVGLQSTVDLSSYPEVQQNEFLATEAIYSDGFVRLHGRKDAWKNQENLAFQVRLACLENPDIFVKVDFEFAKDYPKVPLKVSVIETHPQNQKLNRALADIVTSVPRTNLGFECVHEVTSRIDELLNNAEISRVAKENPFSLEEERANREAQARVVAQREEELLRMQQQTEASRNEQALALRLESERKRREQAKTSSTEEMDHDLDVQQQVTSVMFDQPITVQDTIDGKDIKFKQVDGRLMLTRREDKVMVLVTPTIAKTEGNPPQLLLKGIYLPQTLGTNDALVRTMRLVEELLEQSRIQRHPNVIDLLGYKITHPLNDTDTWELDILSEWAKAGSVENLLQLSGPLTPSKVKDWTLQIVEALAFFDQHEFVHPAVHLGNVLICRTEQGFTIKLSDGYGTALRDLVDKARKAKPSNSTTQPFWIAPELTVDNPKRTAQTCIWDLGKVILQMALGIDVFDLYSSPSDCLKRKSFASPFRSLLTAMFRNEPTKRPNAFKLKAFSFFFDRDPSLFQPEHMASGKVRLKRSLEPTSMRWETDWTSLGKLGKGGQGLVVKARNVNDQGIYAVKIIKAEGSDTLTQIRQEVLLLKDLQHPSIVRYYATWIEHDLVLDPNDGESDESEQNAADFRSDRHAPDTDRDYDDLDNGQDFTTMNQLNSVNGGPTSSELESAAKVFEGQGGYFSKPKSGDSDDDSEDYDKAFDGPAAPSNELANDPIDFNPFDDVASSSGKANDNISVWTGHKLSRTTSSQHQRDVDRLLGQAQERNQKSTMYIQMEYCDQKTLRQLINNQTLLSDLDKMWLLFRSILEGLQYIHDQGITHRDLKPENIFLDSYNNPKIGDFGLATAAFAAYGSGDVGTPFYIAPELLTLLKNKDLQAGKLGSKVDMYSLGVMFFEMNVLPLRGMERADVLKRLSKKHPDLPHRFEEPDFQLQGKLIKELVDHDPSARPEASELLSRSEIPEPIEDERLDRRIYHITRTNPERVLTVLRDIENDDVLDLAWEYKKKEDNAVNPAVADHIVGELRTIFHRHGAVSTPRQGIFPRASQYEKAFSLFGYDGIKLQLPVDLTLPFARSIAHHPPAYSKVYTFGTTYRPRPTRSDGDEPLHVPEIDFDIVSYKTRDLPLKEAALIRVLDDIIQTFPPLQPDQWVILLNHNDLLDLILGVCGIKDNNFSRVKKQLANLYVKGFNKDKIRERWENIRTNLRSEAFNVRETSVATLFRFVHVFGTLDDVRKQIYKLLEKENLVADAATTLARLQVLLKFTQRLQVKTTIVIAPLSNNSDGLYPGNVMFQCINGKSGGILAAGGRYDNLIRHYQRGMQDPRICRAVGFRLSLALIAHRLVAAASSSKLTKVQSREKAIPSASGIASRVNVLVTSFDPVSLEAAGLDCLAVLLAGGISAELTEEVESMEELEEMYASDGQYWLVIVKGTALEENGKVKVRVLDERRPR